MSIDLQFETRCSNCNIVAYTGHTQKNGAVSKVNSIETAPFFCVCPVYLLISYWGMHFSSITLKLSIQDSVLFIKFACS
jgi:hypothetical protein